MTYYAYCTLVSGRNTDRRLFYIGNATQQCWSWWRFFLYRLDGDTGSTRINNSLYCLKLKCSSQQSGVCAIYPHKTYAIENYQFTATIFPARRLYWWLYAGRRYRYP